MPQYARHVRLLASAGLGVCLAAGLVHGAGSQAARAQTQTQTDPFRDRPETDGFVLRNVDATPPEPDLPASLEPPADAGVATGTVTDPNRRAQAVAGRQNARTVSVDGVQVVPDSDEEALGIRAGRFMMRPSLTQRIAVESNGGAGGRSERTYSQTEGAISILSDWSRHALAVDGRASFEENLSGSGQTEPQVNLDAVLTLDLFDGMEGQLRAGYDFYREDETDPNALTGASVQAGVHEFSAGAGLSRDVGLLRSSLDVDGVRTLYGDATLADGTRLNLDDRDETSVTVTSRLGYAVSPALTPFLEAAVTRTEFDQRADRNGFERSASTYALRSGVEIDLGEKWFGEIAAGYALRSA
jgi:hypothetical protein